MLTFCVDKKKLLDNIEAAIACDLADKEDALAKRDTKIVHSLFPEDLQAEIVRILLFARTSGRKEVPLSDMRELLDRGEATPVRVLASSQEILQAVDELGSIGIVILERGFLRFPG